MTRLRLHQTTTARIPIRIARPVEMITVLFYYQRARSAPPTPTLAAPVNAGSPTGDASAKKRSVLLVPATASRRPPPLEPCATGTSVVALAHHYCSSSARIVAWLCGDLPCSGQAATFSSFVAGENMGPVNGLPIILVAPMTTARPQTGHSAFGFGTHGRALHRARHTRLNLAGMARVSQTRTPNPGSAAGGQHETVIGRAAPPDGIETVPAGPLDPTNTRRVRRMPRCQRQGRVRRSDRRWDDVGPVQAGLDLGLALPALL